MPVRKNFLLELAIFVSVILITSHITTHLWDRHFLRREINNMRKSLHSLKTTMADIETAYDTLHKDVKQIVKHKPCKNCCHSPDHRLDRRKQHDINVVSILEQKKASMVCKEVQTRQNTAYNKYCLSTNASTITRYPLKSTGVGIETRKYYASNDDCTCKNIRRTIKV